MGSLKKLDKAGDVLKNFSFFTNVDMSEAQNYSKIFTSWESIVGRKLAGYSRIKDLDKQSLIIEADHPAIIQLLQMNYSHTLYKLNRKYPELHISDIRILLKDPNITYEKRKETMNLAGDNDDISTTDRKKVDLDSIENENFKDLLLKMKKRSQV